MTKHVTIRVIDLEETGKNLKKLMKQRGVGVLEVADVLTTSPQSVYKWLNGKCLPSIDNLLNLAGILEVTMEQIIVYEVLKSSPSREDFSSPEGDFNLYAA